MAEIIKQKHYGISMRSVYLVELNEYTKYKVAVCVYDKESKKSNKILQSFYYHDFGRAEEAYEIISECIL